MERELEELAVRAAEVLGAAIDAETEARAEAWRDVRSWFLGVSAPTGGGATMFHLFWEGAFSFRARHILESLALTDDQATAAARLRELVAHYETDVDPTPSTTPTPPPSPDRADRVATLTSMLVGAKLERPALSPLDDGHPTPAPEPPSDDDPPPRDHVDFRGSTITAPVMGSVTGDVYINHLGPTPSHLDPSTWPTLADLSDADALDHGVREARRLEDGPELPLYAVRDVETGRDWFGDGGLLVITGRRFAGKTRTAWEALSELPPDTRVFAPSPGTDLRTLPALLAGRSGRHVLWLDDLDAHLRERDLDVKLLAELTKARVQVVGTMNDDVYDAHMDETDSMAHRLLARAKKARLSTVWSDTELERARDGEDPRLTEALEWRGDTGVTQYLAVAPLLADTWRRMLGARSLRGFRESLLPAAVGLAQCGVRGDIPEDLLTRALATYDPSPRHNSGTVDEALAWASERRYGVTGFLVPGVREGTWRPHGSLVAAALRENAPVPFDVWRLVLKDTSYGPEDRHTVHINARTFFTPQAEKGTLDAMYLLGLLKEAEGDTQSAMYWFRKAADAGWYGVAERVGAHFLGEGHAEQALPYLRTATEKSPTPTAHRLLAEAHLALAEQALHRAAAVDRQAAGQLGDLDLRLADASRAAQYYIRKDQPAPLARNLAAYHVLRGETETAQPYLERAAHDGDDRAVRILDDIRAEPQTLQDAESYFRGSTDPQDLAHLGVVLERSGRSTEALRTYDEAAAQGDPFARARAEALRRGRDTVDG
ncbi:tetratricopeptide repeat protein [Streptomyces sp. 4F14]|uniref:tetratricopeptide repeat protein n=1 Tax=Streptomyces sp. 4F14 TaxID=3394380 RepID=UPI003A860983